MVMIAILPVGPSSAEKFTGVPAETADPAGEVIHDPTDIVGPAEKFTAVPSEPVGPTEEFMDDPSEVIYDADHILAEVKVSAGLYDRTEMPEAAAAIPAGTRVRVEQTTDPLWYLVILDDTAQKQWGVTEAVWYMYAENLCRVENNEAVDTTLYEEYVTKCLNELREIFPHGKYWNHVGSEISVKEPTPYYVTDTPCTHHTAPGNNFCSDYCNRYYSAASRSMNMQCLGFARLLSDEIFGENAPVHSYRDLNQLRVGDHIRFKYNSGNHSVTVTGIYDTYITVVEVNRDFRTCKIEWERRVDYTELEKGKKVKDIIFYTRYPFNYTGTGYTPW